MYNFFDRFEDLLQRFETPNSRNRWDSPLFIVRPVESEEEKKEEVNPNCMITQHLPVDDIVKAALQGRRPRPNAATIPVKFMNFLLLF